MVIEFQDFLGIFHSWNWKNPSLLAENLHITHTGFFVLQLGKVIRALQRYLFQCCFTMSYSFLFPLIIRTSVVVHRESWSANLLVLCPSRSAILDIWPHCPLILMASNFPDSLVLLASKLRILPCVLRSSDGLDLFVHGFSISWSSAMPVLAVLSPHSFSPLVLLSSCVFLSFSGLFFVFWSSYLRNKISFRPALFRNLQETEPQDRTASRPLVLHCSENPIHVFPEMKLRGLFPTPTFMYLWAFYIFSGSVCSFISGKT